MTVPLLDILRASPWPLTVTDKRVPPHDGSFTPVGILVHHTATKGAGLSVVQKGRPGLAGPLAQLNLARDGKVHVVTEGLAWHAGSGSGVVLTETKRDIAPSGDAKARGLKDDSSGNRWYIGIEVDNDGVGEHYPQITALERTCATLCKHFGWTANRVVHHREHTARKIDMSYRGDLRGAVAKLLAPPPTPLPPPRYIDVTDQEIDMARFVEDAVRLDPQGCGYRDLDVPQAKVIGAPVVISANDPAKDGSYARIPVAGVRANGAGIRVVFTGGHPSTQFSYRVAVIA